jgi:hypothetical protein
MTELENDIVGSIVDLLDICIRADTSFTMQSDTDVPRWLELLTVAQAAELVIRCFGARPDSGRTLAENFANPSLERATNSDRILLVPRAPCPSLGNLEGRDVRASMKKNESYGDPARVYDPGDV